MMLLHFLVLFHRVHADVIRDDGYNNYEGQFTFVHKGRMLCVLMYFNNIQEEECALHCVRHLRCRTFNYHPVKKACELTNEDFDETDADKISPGWYNHGTPAKVNGGLGSWRNFTECTKTCKNGTLEQWRDCDSPNPEYGGVYCKGRMRRRVKCNTHECPVVNVALLKKSKQSTTDGTSVPSRAVDGNPDTRAVTYYKFEQWWEVDLEEVRVIKHVRLKAVVHSNVNQKLWVETRKTKEESWTLCENIGSLKNEVTDFSCAKQSTNAQFFRIRSTKQCRLNIREVEIYGY